MIAGGDGPYLVDIHGRRRLDAISGLFANLLGHDRADLSAAVARDAEGHQPRPRHDDRAVELAARLAAHAPGDLNRVFLSSDSGAALTCALTMATRYFAAIGKARKRRVVHATAVGSRAAASSLGVPCPIQEPEARSCWLAEQIQAAFEERGPHTVAALMIEPVQISDGWVTPPPGLFRRLRSLCDEYDVLLISHEGIGAFGRLGYWFAAERYDLQPDILLTGRGITSGHSTLDAVIASDRLLEPFLHGSATCERDRDPGDLLEDSAIALATLDALEGEGVLEHVRAHEDAFHRSLERLLDIPTVGAVRGAGFLYGVRLVEDRIRNKRFDEARSRRLGHDLQEALAREGLLCGVAGHRDPVVQLAPPLTCDQSHVDQITETLGLVLARLPNL